MGLPKEKHHLHIELTAEQYQQLCRQAKLCGLSKRAYIVRLIDGTPIRARPSQEIKDKVIQTLDACGWQVDTVLSHTCPYPYEPREAFLPMIDQSTVDDSTEKWLEEIERKLKYDHWFCGHWHIDKHIDRMHFLFHSVEAAPQLLTGGDTL